MIRALLVLSFALATPALAEPTPTEGIFEDDRRDRTPGKLQWHISFAGKAERRAVSFAVSDAACALDFMANTRTMVEAIPFVHEATTREHSGNQYLLELTEKFFLVGDAFSKYRRTVGDQQVSWILLDGRAKRHDGSWRVESTPSGATVHFANVIEAKNFIHQSLLNGIQKRSMATIVESAQARCGAGL